MKLLKFFLFALAVYVCHSVCVCVCEWQVLHTFESARAAANMINKVKLETGTGKLRIRNVAMHSLHMAATTTNGQSDTWRCQLGTVFKAPPHTHTHMDTRGRHVFTYILQLQRRELHLLGIVRRGIGVSVCVC